MQFVDFCAEAEALAREAAARACGEYAGLVWGYVNEAESRFIGVPDAAEQVRAAMDAAYQDAFAAQGREDRRQLLLFHAEQQSNLFS